MDRGKGYPLYLREAVMQDCDLLYLWCNDPQCRVNSFSMERISYEEHCRWFSEKMATEDSRIYICMRGEDAVGQVRLDLEGNQGKISYFIQEDCRGRGFGYRMLWLLEEKAPRQVELLYGMVKEANTASQRCFEKLGYQRRTEDGFYRYWKERGEDGW